jgi:diaminohydroxyphosphoribosylaminopyrimidine deaminase/5-amino-6-(5-phosphoribosylamino)uracil reductase
MAGERPAARDSALMRRALANAERGWGQTAPNPMVGAVVVSGTEVVGEGWHRSFGGPHAEVEALRVAGDRARGSTMYVTLEPCTHQAKTPPCTDSMIAAGVQRVVIAARDPNPLAKGGVEQLRSAGIQVDVGIEAAAACELNAAFFNSFASDRPWVTLKLAMSADGAIADPTGQRRWISGPESRAEGHRMRAGVDAIAVGIGTVLADDPELTVRDVPAPRRPPVRVIFDSRLRMPIDSAIVESASRVPTVIVARRPEVSRLKSLAECGIKVLPADDLLDGLRQLRSEGIHALLVEGGAQLAGSLLSEKVVDRLAIFQAPVKFGNDALKGFAYAPQGTEDWLKTLPIVDRRTFGEDTLITYAVREVPCSPA